MGAVNPAKLTKKPVRKDVPTKMFPYATKNKQAKT